MKKNLVRMISAFTAAVLISSTFAGCTGTKDTTSSTTTSSAPETQNSTGSAYPVKTDVTLTYWAELNPNVQATSATLNDTPFYKELEKKTGIKVEFLHPAVNQAKEQLNIMLSSGELPDMIEYDWYGFPGGPEKAIKDGYITKLNDVIDQNAPNLKKYLSENPDIDKMIKTDSGSYYNFPFLRGDEILTVYNGPMIRKDWLDELGLQVPTTIDEWYTVLKAFKEKKGADAPLSFVTTPDNQSGLNFSAFLGAFDISRRWYVEDNKVKYGPNEAGFKNFITTFQNWYGEGLIDKNIATVDIKSLDSNIANGKTGATIGYAGSTLGKYINSLQPKDPKFNLVATPYPTLKKGDKVKYAQKDLKYTNIQGCVAITTQCKNVDMAAKFLDYGYSDEGHILYNFGIEGISYNMDNGYPKYTDLVMKNPDKLPVAQAMAKYFRGGYSGPFVQDKRYIEQFYVLPQQKDALATWMKTDADKYILPKVTASAEESSEIAQTMNEIDTFVNESFFKFVLGADSLDNYDKYYSRVKQLGMDRAIELQQSALDRYIKR